MSRIFLGLAVADGTLLVVTLMLGLFVPSEQGGFVHDLHFLIALLTLMVHGVVYTYFPGTGKRSRPCSSTHHRMASTLLPGPRRILKPRS